MAMKKDSTLESIASTAKGFAKTWVTETEDPEKRIDEAEGPAPKPLTPKAPADYYTGYGAYAPRKLASERGKSQRKRSTKK